VAAAGPRGPEADQRPVADIQRNRNDGIGKPEPLKHGFQGYWSRRITDEHRLVYKVIQDEIRIVACRYHYNRSASILITAIYG
jgi:Txe/YoeB family toxin of toxin-antitoxin system